jgi:hypothetical protein
VTAPASAVSVPASPDEVPTFRRLCTLNPVRVAGVSVPIAVGLLWMVCRRLAARP